MSYVYTKVGMSFPSHKIVTAMATVAKDSIFMENLLEFRDELSPDEPTYEIAESSIMIIKDANIAALADRIKRNKEKPTATVEDGCFLWEGDEDDLVEDMFLDYLSRVLDILFYDSMVENPHSAIADIHYIEVSEIRIVDMDNVYFLLKVGARDDG